MNHFYRNGIEESRVMNAPSAFQEILMRVKLFFAMILAILIATRSGASGPTATAARRAKPQVPVAELHVSSFSFSGGDCCWDFAVYQEFGVSGNIMYIDAQVTTPGVTVSNPSGPPGSQAPIVLSPTSVRWYMPTPDGLWNTLPQTLSVCFANIPATGATLTLTGYDNAGNTQTFEQASVTIGQFEECPCNADLWMKDTMSPDLPEDFGAEPNTVSPQFYISRDIWVRTSPDTTTGLSLNPGPDNVPYYAAEHQHQNPVYVNSSTPSYVYVKVRNRGVISGTPVLRVYWADASTGLPWPGSSVWNEIDCVPGGGPHDPCPLPTSGFGNQMDYVVQLPWVPPNPQAFAGHTHFCLLARIETVPTGAFGMTFPEGVNLLQNVANNNNIVWKNLTVLSSQAPGEGGGGHVIVRNTLKNAAPITLRLQVPRQELKQNFLLYGDVLVKLGEAIMTKLRLGGQRLVGFTVIDKATIKMTDPARAEVSGLLFAAGEEQTIEVRMVPKGGAKLPLGRTFNVDLIELAPLKKDEQPTFIGGERYALSTPRARG
jgi:hypothetical protein